MIARVNPDQATTLALDVIDLERVLGKPEITMDEWASVFYRSGVPKKVSLRRQWQRWISTAAQAGLGRAFNRGSHSAFVFDMARAYEWAQSVLGEPYQEYRAQRFVPAEYFAYGSRRKNVPSVDEIMTGRGYQSVESWRGVLPLADAVASDLLAVLADQQVPMTVRELAEHVREGRRGHVVVGPHAGRRSCGSCGVDHRLHQHASHAFSGSQRFERGSVRDRVGAAQRAVALLARMGFVERQGRKVVVTVTGYEAGIVDAQLRTEQAVEGFDPAAEWEAGLGRRAPELDTSFEFGAAANPLLAIVGMGNAPCGCGCDGRACKNPLLALVGMGNPGPSNDQGFVGEVTLANARAYARANGLSREFEKSLKDTKQFHATGADRYAVYRVPDGSKRVTREFATGLGRVPKTLYRGGLGKNSNKNQAELWDHDHEAGAEPLEVKFASTGLTGKLGGVATVTDWWRERGQH